jgi:hypothetical protein
MAVPISCGAVWEGVIDTTFTAPKTGMASNPSRQARLYDICIIIPQKQTAKKEPQINTDKTAGCICVHLCASVVAFVPYEIGGTYMLGICQAR